MNQLYRFSQKTFILPMDHGITMGPVMGIKNILPVIRQVSDKIDAVVVHKGLVSQIIHHLNFRGCRLIIHLSASTALSPDPNRKELVTSVEHAIKMGATAVSVHVNLGSETEAAMLRDLGRTAECCESWGIPLLAMMYVRDGLKESEYDPEKIKHAARVAEELGADIVKVNYTGSVETFSEVVGSVKIPVIIAGGSRMSSDPDVLAMVSDAIRAGAGGVAIGRNLFQHNNPESLAGGIRRILDEGTAGS